MSDIQNWREPISLAAGDTINFNRTLVDYPASDGWLLKYEIRGGAQVIEFSSTNTNGGDPQNVMVTAATTAGWIPGQYVLCGFAENQSTGERVQIYYNSLTITPNLEGAAGDIPVQTHAQKMLAIIIAVQEGKATHDIIESDVESTRIRRMSPKELRVEYAYWYQKVQNENAVNASRSGMPSPNKIHPEFHVKSPGPALGVTGFYDQYQR